jgi:hypothetical protein
MELGNFFVPAALQGPANHLAMILGAGPEDARTYEAAWDGPGGDVFYATHLVDDRFRATFAVLREAAAGADSPAAAVAAIRAAMTRPAWDTDDLVDLDAAALAAASVVQWHQPAEDDPPPFDARAALAAGRIVAVMGLPDMAALALVGVTRKPAPEDDP